jgi:hypothetical protein
MKRSVLSMIGVLAFIGIALSASSAMAIDGPLAIATVSFGLWDPNDPDLNGDPTAMPPVDNRFPLDRLVNDPSGGRGNFHELIPDHVTIKQGGAVNFIISGGHVVAVYEDGTQPGDIGSAIEPPCPAVITSPCSPGTAANPTAGGILSNSNGRIYRGAFLNVNPARRDGVEVVQFTMPGTYLVICARKNHFENDDMFGFVKVLPGNAK